MTSFGWKRKLGEKISKEKVQKFTSESKNDSDHDDDVDWQGFPPNKKALLIEDSIAKSERLKKEGIVLAEAERFWEAISKWNEAVQLTPTNETLMEMKSQALMAVGEVLPALQAAQKAVELSPLWWVAHQTMGRAHVNIGEVNMALKCFSRAIHLNPSESELWNEDLKWTQSLLAGRRVASISTSTSSKVKRSVNESDNGVTIKELENDSESESEVEETNTSNQLITYSYTNVANVDSLEDEMETSTGGEASLVRIPANYVHMRDPT